MRQIIVYISYPKIVTNIFLKTDNLPHLSSFTELHMHIARAHDRYNHTRVFARKLKKKYNTGGQEKKRRASHKSPRSATTLVQCSGQARSAITQRQAATSGPQRHLHGYTSATYDECAMRIDGLESK